MGHFLVDRGCTALSISNHSPTLERNDLLNLLDLCSGCTDNYCQEEDPAVEVFFLRRGIQIRKRKYVKNVVIRILQEGFRASSFSSRVELVKHHLMQDPALASKIDLFNPRSPEFELWYVTPLGALELFGTPRTEIWSGENRMPLARFFSVDEWFSRAKDEWQLTRPNESEIQALRDIKEALIHHGADPEFLYGPNALNELLRDGYDVLPDAMKRMIHGRADVNNKGLGGLTPLTLILRRESLNSRKKFEAADTPLVCGADINALDDNGRSALFQSIAECDVETVQWLLNNGAGLDIMGSSGK